MDMGVHCIDLMQYITGSKVTEVMALNDTLSFQYEVEDTSTVLMRLENGCQCVVQSNFNIPDAAAKWRLEFFGEQGRLLGENIIGQVDGGTLDTIFIEKQGAYNAKQDTNEAYIQSIDAEFGNMYAREIESFSNSLINDTPLDVPAEDAVYVQRVVEAAYASSESGCAKCVV